MKRFMMTGFLCAVSGLLSATPTIVPATCDFSQSGTRAIITYTLQQDPAIVTIDIETNTQVNATGKWVSIGGENVQTLSGDVNRLVREVGTPRTVVWRTNQDWPDHGIANGIRAVVTAWATNHPPDWLVFGLEKQNDVRFYASTNFIPYGLSSDYYKTNAVVMRKIPAEGVIWQMGSPDTESNRDATREILHNVMFTRDYYMAIYETTQAQYSKIVRNSKGEPVNPSGWTGLPDSSMRPVERVQLWSLRGQNAADGPTVWPESGHNVVSGCSIDKFRSHTGLELDLPTEAQWEFACRAGMDGPYNDGASSPANIAWYKNNSWMVTNETTSAGVRLPHVVGLKNPNAFGLYDMHGNVQELCLDHLSLTNDFTATFTTSDYALRGMTLDPIGTWTSTPTVHPATHALNYNQAIIRGGYYNSESYETRSAMRENGSYNYSAGYNGFRFCLPAIFR